MGKVELHIPPDTRFVGLARLVVVAAARNAGMAEERREDLRIAVSEATTNAILAHQRAESRAPVVLRFGTAGYEFQVEIADTGPGFDPAIESRQDRDWSAEGGLGITLIRGLADDVEFVRGEGMRVSLRFAVSLSNGAAASQS